METGMDLNKTPECSLLWVSILNFPHNWKLNRKALPGLLYFCSGKNRGDNNTDKYDQIPAGEGMNEHH